MLRRTVARKIFDGFFSGFSKGWSRKQPRSSGDRGLFQGFTNSGSGGPGGLNFGFGGPGGRPGGPFSGLLDKALEWCSESHAHQIAREQGIDVRAIRFEKTAQGGVNVVVDAPNATQLQIEELGRRVQEECPVARFRKTQVDTPSQQMKWLRLPDRYDR